MNVNPDVPTAPHRSQERRRFEAPLVTLAVLYVPQSWYFLMNYPWNEYRLFWLKFFPGLPVFMPVALLAHPNDTFMLAGTWLFTALLAAALYFIHRHSIRGFRIAAVIVCLWSIVSAFGAYGAFRA